MPTYHYRCADCAHEFDQYQRFADDALTVCPSCNGRIRRVIQPVGVVFKGSGWYVTDSRTSNAPSSNGDKAAAKAEGEKTSKETAKTDVKSEAKESTTASKPAAEPKVPAAV